MSSAADEAEVEIKLLQVPANATIEIDTKLIEQVLINLIKNGAESIQQANRPVGQRTVELKVRPRVIDGKDMMEFSVRDNGAGVPSEMLERIYDAFYSTKSEGMGIGLKLCRSIVESHQGKLTVENLYNGDHTVGCVFCFWLPVNPSAKHLASNDSPPPSSDKS